MTKARRGVGEGAIYRRKADGRWTCSVTTGYGPRKRAPRPGVESAPANVRLRTVIYGDTRKEVERKLQALRNNLDKGLGHPDGRTTVAAFLDGWLERKHDLKPATRLRYSGLIQHQLIPHLGHIRLAKLTPEDVDTMLAAVQREGRSPRTAYHCRAVLRTALYAALKRGQVGRNVAALAEPVKVTKPSHTLLTVEEIHRVLDAVAGTDIANMVALSLNSGMRMGEVLGLRWSDVSLDTDQLTVSHALQRLNRQNRLVEPKSATSKRTLTLPGAAIEALRAERQSQVEHQLAAGPRWQPTIEGLVFTDPLGAPLEGTTVLFRFQRALRAAGIPRLRFHHLRHLHAMLLLRNGVDIAVVRDVLGHSSISLTADTYAGIMPALKRDAAERFGKLLQRPG